jgi:hypothetical protein
MMYPVPRGNEIVEHKPMNEIFGEGPYDNAHDEKLRGGYIPSGEIASRTTASKHATNISPK